jgi:hypothetical protein
LQPNAGELGLDFEPALISLFSHQGEADKNILRRTLRRMGLAKYRGEQIVIVAPDDSRLYGALFAAVFAETGIRPNVVQTEGQRTLLGIPGPILDRASPHRGKKLGALDRDSRRNVRDRIACALRSLRASDQCTTSD